MWRSGSHHTRDGPALASAVEGGSICLGGSGAASGAAPPPGGVCEQLQGLGRGFTQLSSFVQKRTRSKRFKEPNRMVRQQSATHALVAEGGGILRSHDVLYTRPRPDADVTSPTSACMVQDFALSLFGFHSALACAACGAEEAGRAATACTRQCFDHCDAQLASSLSGLRALVFERRKRAQPQELKAHTHLRVLPPCGGPSHDGDSLGLPRRATKRRRCLQVHAVAEPVGPSCDGCALLGPDSCCL